MRDLGSSITLAAVTGVCAWLWGGARQLPARGWPLVSAEAQELAPAARRVAIAFGHRGASDSLGSALARGSWVMLGPGVPGGDCLIARFPLAAHLAQWRASPDGSALVAAGRSGIPLAFDRDGRLHRLDPTHPPRTPVLVIARAADEWDCAESWLCPSEAAGPACHPELLDLSPDGRARPRRPAPCVQAAQ